MASASNHYDFQRLHDCFAACLTDSDNIQIDDYLNVYDELSKILKLMGHVFTFCTIDVVEKVGILRDYRESDEKEHYETIQSMIHYEVKNNLTRNSKKRSGSRTLLRLHRALAFVADYFRAVTRAEDSAKLSRIAMNSYNRTLSKYHTWIVRKGVDIAVSTLPSRKRFIKKLKLGDVKQTAELLEKSATMGDELFDYVEKLYSENDILDLP